MYAAGGTAVVDVRDTDLYWIYIGISSFTNIRVSTLISIMKCSTSLGTLKPDRYLTVHIYV